MQIRPELNARTKQTTLSPSMLPNFSPISGCSLIDSFIPISYISFGALLADFRQGSQSLSWVQSPT